MSTPLQRAEELKSLISQYQAELSDIYSEIHSSKINQKPQIICLMTVEYFENNSSIELLMDNNVKSAEEYLSLSDQYNYQDKLYNDVNYGPNRYYICYNNKNWFISHSNNYPLGASKKNVTRGYYSYKNFYPVMFV